MRFEVEALACDRPADKDPDTGEKRGDWTKHARAMRAYRRLAEDLVDTWRLLELGQTAAYILSEEREQLLQKRIQAFNARPNRRHSKPAYRRPNPFRAPWDRELLEEVEA
jgi:hypothetical protein